MQELPIVHKKKLDEGRYIAPSSSIRRAIPSGVECPYCKALMVQEVGSARHAILRLSRAGKTYGDILPGSYIVLTCEPCKQQFCQEG